MMTPSLPRRLAAEAVGTAVLAAVLVGSGIQASALSGDGGVAFLANVLASVLALAVLIALLAPVSGAHLNPLVSAALWWTERRSGTGLTLRELGGYVAAQLAGAVAGAGLANAMYARPFLELSDRERSAGHLWLAEAVATGVLLLLVLGLGRTGRGGYAPVAVAAWIAAACWGTSSGSFANPALTLGRALSDSYTGIAPGSVPGFVLAQCGGAAAGLALAVLLFRSTQPPTVQGLGELRRFMACGSPCKVPDHTHSLNAPEVGVAVPRAPGGAWLGAGQSSKVSG